MEFRVIGLNIKPSPPPKVNESEAKSLGVSKKFLENEFKDSLKKINRNVTLQIQDLLNIYGRYGWEHYYQGQIGNQITLYFRRDMNESNPKLILNYHQKKRLFSNVLIRSKCLNAKD